MKIAENANFETKEIKKMKKEQKPTKKTGSAKKIGSLPLGYNENDTVFIENGKIYITKNK